MCENKRQLTDQELGSASGGDTLDILRRIWNGERPTSLVKTANMQEVGSYWGGQLYYYPCSQCGHPMHDLRSGVLRCDACGNLTNLPLIEPWGGTEEELKVAAG